MAKGTKLNCLIWSFIWAKEVNGRQFEKYKVVYMCSIVYFSWLLDHVIYLKLRWEENNCFCSALRNSYYILSLRQIT